MTPQDERRYQTLHRMVGLLESLASDLRLLRFIRSELNGDAAHIFDIHHDAAVDSAKGMTAVFIGQVDELTRKYSK